MCSNSDEELPENLRGGNMSKGVTVFWTDAKTWSNMWLDDPEDLVLPECISKGFIVKETPTAMFLAQTVSDSGGFNNIIGIPRSSIRKVKDDYHFPSR